MVDTDLPLAACLLRNPGVGIVTVGRLGRKITLIESN